MVPVELRRRCGLDFTAPGKSFEEKVAELASAIRGEVAERKGPAVTLDFYYQEHLPIANIIILEIASTKWNLWRLEYRMRLYGCVPLPTC